MYEEDQVSDTVGVRMVKMFKSLWKLPVFPRIKHFLWKASSSLLSTRDVLSLKVPAIANICPYCDQNQESPAHVIRYCNHPRMVWFALFGWSASGDPSFAEWIIQWCDKVFQNITAQPEKTIKKCKSFFEDHAIQWNKTTSTDNRRKQQAAKCIQLKGISSAEEAEFKGLREAVKWAHSLKLKKMILNLTLRQ
ncbi:uncharacterized protein LOC113311270 [Papaver somniferum]|uniref:uncharacterized protein LOC113311270 n=1 Tax=Papaver somniferum TaxID=3469 RepID=UPI000E6FC599|nr:uncharacterized protein LOC113311270 [Papaver somniferum]